MRPDLTNDDFLGALREFQDSARAGGYTFGEYREDPGLHKAPAGVGIGSGFNAGVGMMGRGNTSSFAPTGPNGRRSGNQAVGYGGEYRTPQFGIPTGLAPEGSFGSKYFSRRPDQPPPWIDDVDMANIWYSPMEPVWPFGPPNYNTPREWNFPVGYNLNYVPARLELAGMLRGMRQSWGVLATIIETRKDQILRLPWTIQRKDKPRAGSKSVDEMRKFFRRPDGKLTYGQWSRKLLDDLFVIDAPTIFLDRDRGGKIRNLEILDGGTIFPLIDDAGRRPDSRAIVDSNGISYTQRQPAFQQIIYGLPMLNLSEDEIMYSMMRPRPELPIFGYSPVEQILTEATEAIRKTFYQLEFWRAGSMPELIVSVPDNWTPRQIAMFQGHFDALLSGNLVQKSKVRFLPGAMKPFEVKNASGENIWSQRDELLVRLCCYAFSVSPTPFVKQTNRATAQSAQQTADAEGLYPLMSWWKDDIMDVIIQDKFGYDDIEFVFLPSPEIDGVKRSQIHAQQLHDGVRSINEIRVELGEEPVEDGDNLLIYVGNTALRLDQVIAGDLLPAGSPAPDGPPRPASGTGATPDKSGSAPMQGPAKPPQASNLPPASSQSKSNPPRDPTPIKKASKGEVKSAAKDADQSPTPQQKKFGNYPKGHVWIQGLNISIENAKGSKRGEKDKFGRGWEVKMPAAYGYIRGTVGADGDQIDVYLGPKPQSTVCWIIDQDKFDPDGTDRGFDEHKVFIGYKSYERALKDYLKSHFDNVGKDRVSAITEMSTKDLKKWLRTGDPKRPISEQGIGVVVARRGTGPDGIEQLLKADTISSSTGLNSYDQTLAVPRRKSRRKKSRLYSGPKWLSLTI